MEQHLPESAKRKVGDIMTTDIITIAPDTRVSDIASLIVEHHITGLPVVTAEGQVLGVVTELDMIIRNTQFKMPNYMMILDMMIYLERPKKYKKRLNHVLGTRAEQIMSRPAVTIEPSATIEELAELMVEQRMNPVPVVEDEKLVGVVSRGDIIRLMASRFAHEDDDEEMEEEDD